MSQDLRISCTEIPDDKLRITKGDMGLWFELETNCDSTAMKMHKDDVKALIIVLQHYIQTGNLEEQK